MINESLSYVEINAPNSDFVLRKGHKKSLSICIERLLNLRIS